MLTRLEPFSKSPSACGKGLSVLAIGMKAFLPNAVTSGVIVAAAIRSIITMLQTDVLGKQVEPTPAEAHHSAVQES